MPESSTIDQTLAERGKTYGSFSKNATAAQRLKTILHDSLNWDKLAPDQREALEIIASKMSRLLTGDPNHVDSWHDIAGYAILIEKRLLAEKEAE